jgi:hypothetical protein
LVLRMRFSPDGHYFLAGAVDSEIMVDLATHQAVPMHEKIRDALRYSFAFSGPDRLVGVNREYSPESWVLRFPSGEVEQKVKLGRQMLESVTHGNYVLLRDVQDYPIASMDLKTSKLVMGNKTGALDYYDDVFASEQKNGEIALSNKPGGEALATVKLPLSDLGILQSYSVSDDLGLLAISTHSRGGIYDLKSNSRLVHVRGFEGSTFAADGTFFGDFPKMETTPRSIAKYKAGMTGPDAAYGIDMYQDAEQHGVYLFTSNAQGRRSRWYVPSNGTVEIHDVRTKDLLWSRTYKKELPELRATATTDTVSFAWPMEQKTPKEEVKADPRFAARNFSEGDHLIEVFDGHSGRELGRVVVDTGKGSFAIGAILTSPDAVVITDNRNRIIVYSLNDGAKRANFFGHYPAISPDGKLLAFRNERDQVTMVDLAKGTELKTIDFDQPVSITSFSKDGKRILVLTKKQQVYILDVQRALAPDALTAQAVH